MTEKEAYAAAGFPHDQRRYDIACKILNLFGARSVRLISDNDAKRAALEEYFKVVVCSPSIVHLGPACGSLLHSIQQKNATSPVPVGGRDSRRLVVIGDLNIDYRYDMQQWIDDPIVDAPKEEIGGTAFFSAKAFQAKHFTPIVIGSVGSDSAGRKITNGLQSQRICALLRVRDDLPTGRCHLIRHNLTETFKGQNRILIKTGRSANTYDIDDISQALDLVGLTRDDTVFLFAHAMERIGSGHLRDILQLVRRRKTSPGKRGPKVVLDLVPHDIWTKRNKAELDAVLKVGREFLVDVMIAELPTLWGFIHGSQSHSTFTDQDWIKIGDDDKNVRDLLRQFPVGAIVLRYGFGSCEFQRVWNRKEKSITAINETGYRSAKLDGYIGFGDTLTAALLERRDI